jgi:16S rRNA C967 or C1407 C5-methylase (RsmB/RsmF family)
VAHTTLEELQKHASYQRKFVKQAVGLLKPGGFMTYSTCTINSEENEQMVRHILQDYPMMKLQPINANIGQAGLAGAGLSDDDRNKVRRFDPHNIEADTMGFFLALFQKKEIV